MRDAMASSKSSVAGGRWLWLRHKILHSQKRALPEELGQECALVTGKKLGLNLFAKKKTFGGQAKNILHLFATELNISCQQSHKLYLRQKRGGTEADERGQQPFTFDLSDSS